MNIVEMSSEELEREERTMRYLMAELNIEMQQTPSYTHTHERLEREIITYRREYTKVSNQLEQRGRLDRIVDRLRGL